MVFSFLFTLILLDTEMQSKESFLTKNPQKSQSKFQNLVNKAIKYSQKHLMDISTKESSYEQGIYRDQQSTVEVLTPFTGVLSKEIKGYAIEDNILAIVSSGLNTSETFIRKGVAFLDAKKQKFYMMKDIKEHEGDIFIIQVEEVPPSIIFGIFNLQGTISRPLQANGEPSMTKTFSKDFNWETKEGEDAFEDGRPKTESIKNTPFEAGVGAHLELKVETSMTFNLLDRFFMDMDIEIKGIAGALFKFGESEVDEIELFSTEVTLHTFAGFQFLGYEVSLKLKAPITISLKDIKIKSPIVFELYKAYIVTLTKQVHISKSEITQTPFKGSLRSKNENPHFDDVDDFIKQMIDSTISVTPSLKISVRVVGTIGNFEIYAGVFTDFQLPMTIGFNIDACTFPYLNGDLHFKLDVGFEFSGITIPEVTILGIHIPEYELVKPYTYSYPFYESPSITQCLFKKSGRSSSELSFSDDKSYAKIGKPFKIDKNMDVNIKPTTNYQYAYFTRSADLTQMITSKKGTKDSDLSFQCNSNEFNLIGRHLTISLENPQESSGVMIQKIDFEEQYAILTMKIKATNSIDQSYKPNTLIFIYMNNFKPDCQYEESIQHYYIVSTTEKMFHYSNNYVEFTIPIVRSSDSKEDTKIELFPLTFQTSTTLPNFLDGGDIKAYESKIVFPAAVSDDYYNNHLVCYTTKKHTSTVNKITLFEGYYLLFAVPNLLGINTEYIAKLHCNEFPIQKTFPNIIHTSIENWAYSIGYTSIPIFITSSEFDTYLYLSDQFYTNKVFRFNDIPGNEIKIYPSCRSIDQSFCYFQLGLERSKDTLVQFESNEGIHPADFNSDSDCFEVEPGFMTQNFYGTISQCYYWKSWKGSYKVLKSYPYQSSASMTVKRYVKNNKDIVCFFLDNQLYPIKSRKMSNTGLNSYLSSLHYSTDYEVSPQTINVTNNGCLEILSSLRKNDVSYNTRYLIEMLGVHVSIPDGSVSFYANEPTETTPAPYYPRATNRPPEPTPARTVLPYVKEKPYPNDEEISGLEEPSNSTAQESNGSKTGTIVAVIVVIAVIILFVIFIWWRKKKAAAADEGSNKGPDKGSDKGPDKDATAEI